MSWNISRHEALLNLGKDNYKTAIFNVPITTIRKPIDRNDYVLALEDWVYPPENIELSSLVELLLSIEDNDVGNLTLAYSQILIDAYNVATPDQLMLVDDFFKKLVNNIDYKQVMLFPEIVSRWVQCLTNNVYSNGDASKLTMCWRMVELLQALLSKMEHTRGITSDTGVRLTSLHIECLKQCLLLRTRALHEAVASRVLNVDIDCFDGFVSERPLEYLRYYYYAGMVYIGLGDIDQAERMLQMLFALPAQNVSQVQVEGYKKLLMISLIKYGCRPYFPTFFPNIHIQTIESNTSSYSVIADTFIRGTTLELKTTLNKLMAEISDDGNQNLTTHVLDAHPKYKIKQSSKIFSSIRLDKLIGHIGFKHYPACRDRAASEVIREYIHNMNDPSVVLDGNIIHFVPHKVTVSQLPNVGGPDICDRVELTWAETLKQKINTTKALRNQIDSLGKKLALTVNYIKGGEGH